MRIAALADIQIAIASRARIELLTVQAIRTIHRTMFGAIFPELAGHTRGPIPDIPANNSFGFRRGIEYERVPDSLTKLDQYLVTLLDQLDGFAQSTDPTRQRFRRNVLEAGSVVHCEIVRIHPFVNGNGRTARLCINYFLVRYGLRPIPIERPKDEYIRAIDAWLDKSDISPMADLLESLAASS